MPFVMSYTDAAGTTHPISYWVIRFQGGDDVGKSGHIIFNGYHDSPSFDVGLGLVGDHRYDISDPAVYDSSFGQAKYASVFSYGFNQILEQTAVLLDAFFNSASWFSSLRPSGVEVGSAGSSAVVVTFPAEVLDQGIDFTTGVTIKINGVAATITGAVKNPPTVLTYAIAEVCDANDVVTWEYDGIGFLTDPNTPLQAFTPITAVNTVGEYLRFDDANNSIWLAVVA